MRGREVSRPGLALIVPLLAGLLVPLGLRADPQAHHQAPLETSVFDLPGVADGISQAYRQLDAGAPEVALVGLAQLAERHPDRPEPWVAAAVVEAARGDAARAISHLTKAVDRGFRGVAALGRRPGIGPTLVAAEGFAALAAAAQAAPAPQAKPPSPATIALPGLDAPVGAGNTAFDAATGRLLARFEIPPVLARRPVVNVTATRRGQPLARVAATLNRWYAQGRAAGNVGDLYDNRDRGHSTLPAGQFPQLARIRYGAEAEARGFDYGPNERFEFGRITIGNSSTAQVKGTAWRSQLRYLMTSQTGPDVLARQAAANQLYVYPAVDDYGPTHGDVMPANTAAALASEGRSFSDKPFLQAFVLALAALKPEVKEELAASGRIAPMLQRLLRRTLAGVETEADYLTARAHPSVFRGEDIDLVRLLKTAQSLELATLPPVVQLAVLSESPARDVDAHQNPVSERLFDTPGSVARIHRRADRVRRLTVSADLRPRPAAGPRPPIVWRVLRGDPSRIEIRPETEDGRVAEITVAWHDRAAVPFRPDLTSGRVDIAAFAAGPWGHSAPAFVSVLFPPDQARRYGPDGRVLEIDYAPDARAGIYADPVLFPSREWRDVYQYGPDGALLGWTRHREASAPVSFTADGHRVVARDAAGRASEAIGIRYALGPLARNGRAPIVPEQTGARFRYVYAGPEDLRGRPVPMPTVGGNPETGDGDGASNRASDGG